MQFNIVVYVPDTVKVFAHQQLKDPRCQSPCTLEEIQTWLQLDMLTPREVGTLYAEEILPDPPPRPQTIYSIRELQRQLHQQCTAIPVTPTHIENGYPYADNCPFTLAINELDGYSHAYITEKWIRFRIHNEPVHLIPNKSLSTWIKQFDQQQHVPPGTLYFRKESNRNWYPRLPRIWFIPK